MFDSERDAFDLCNEVIGHLPAGSSTIDFIWQQLRTMSALLVDAEGHPVPIEAYPSVCKENAECLPIYQPVVPLPNLASALSARLSSPQSPQSPTSQWPAPHLQRSKSPTKSPQQTSSSTLPSPTVPQTTSTTSAASASLAKLPDVITGEIGDDDGYEDAFTQVPQSVSSNMSSPPPPSKSPVLVHNSSDVAGAIERAAASARQHRERQDSNSSANDSVTVEQDTPPARSKKINLDDDRNTATPKHSSTEASDVSSQESHQHI